MSAAFHELLAHAPVVADGALGTLLLDAGLRLDESAEAWNIAPERCATIAAIHAAYHEAGAQIVLTNTIGANPFRLAHAGLADQLVAINWAAADIAHEAVGSHALVAGSIGPTGERLEGNAEDVSERRPTYADAQRGYEAQAAALAAGGVDLFWIETMGDPHEAHAAVVGALRAAPTLPLVVTFAFNDAGRSYTGATVQEIAETLRDLAIAAIGANCGAGLDATERAITALRDAFPDMPLVAKSNLGMPTLHDGRAVYAVSPADFAAHAQRVHKLGAAIVGGCCGSTPQHLRAAALALQPKDTTRSLHAVPRQNQS